MARKAAVELARCLHGKNHATFAPLHGTWRQIASRTGEGTDMKGFVDNIEKLTEENDDFRRVVYTGHNLQLVLMAIQPGDEIGEEVHDDRDQFFRIEGGEGDIWIDGIRHAVKADDGIIVPQGARHNVVSTGTEPLRLYSIYGPPEHIDGTVHKTCAEANAAHEHFDGRTTE